MKVWEAVVNALKAEGVEYVFGLPSGDLFYDVLYDTPEIKTVLVREESAGPFMAMGYARIKGIPGVCYGPAGPGVTNMVSGVLEAFSACLPIVVLGGGSKRQNAGMGAFQEVDQVAIMKPITKWSERITEPQRAPWIIRRAFATAANGRPGPVFIDVPRDVGDMETGFSASDIVPSVYPLRAAGDPDRVAEAVELLLSAEKPVITAGGGAVNSRAFQEVKDLAEMLDIPVMSTACGRGVIPEDHRLSFGLVGLYFTELGQKVYDDADLLITLGSRNEDFQSGEQRFFPKGAKYIQIDLDPEEIARNWIPDAAVVGDVALVLRQMIEEIRKRIGDGPKERAWSSTLAEEKKAHEERMRLELQDDSMPLKTKRILSELNAVFGKNTILVNENGSQDVWSYCWDAYRVLDTNACVAPGEQTCMGGGCAAAIGAKLAMPERNVVCPVGDGAFQMFMKELPTAVQHEAPVTYIVLNNYGLGWIKTAQKKRGDRFISTDFTVQPSFKDIAIISGCSGECVERPEDIRPALERALKANQDGKPAVVEFITDTWDLSPGFTSFYKRLS